MKEETIEDRLTVLCVQANALCYKTVWVGRKGCPDREVTWPWGDVDKVELKRPVGGRYEPGQEQAHIEYARRGVPVYLLSTLDEVEEYVIARTVARCHATHLFSVPLA